MIFDINTATQLLALCPVGDVVVSFLHILATAQRKVYSRRI